MPNKRALLVVRRHLVGLNDAVSPRGLHDVARVAHLMLMMIALVYYRPLMLLHHDRGELIFFNTLRNLLCRTQLLLLEGIWHYYCLVLLSMLRVVLGGLLARAHHLLWVVLVHGFAGRVRKEIPRALFRALLLWHCPLLLSSLFLRHRFLERRRG